MESSGITAKKTLIALANGCNEYNSLRLFDSLTTENVFTLMVINTDGGIVKKSKKIENGLPRYSSANFGKT